MIQIDLKIGKGKRGIEFSLEQKQVITNAALVLQKVLNSSEFKDAILNYHWKHKRKGKVEKFNHTKHSRKKIYNVIMSGNDKFSEEFKDDSNVIGDQDMDVWVHPFKVKPSIVGATKKKTHKSWINMANLENRKLANEAAPFVTVIEIAMNLIHEYCHNLGYKHRGNRYDKHNNLYSVPYAVAEIVNQLAHGFYVPQLVFGEPLLADKGFEVTCLDEWAKI